MKATKLNGLGTSITSSHRKENKLDRAFLVITPDLKQVIDLRCYFSGSTAYACLWITANDYNSGSGKAGGYGYDKRSAAVQGAINKAGYTLSQNIAGVGDSAIKEALLAIAEAEGFNNCKIFEAYG